ncbi:T9SS type A sorting domain-containing protein, partial [bacterium]|nr:T9SS type A sorting domain-containing protein [bacterium]
NDIDASSGLHTNFRLSAEGEELFLSTSNNFIIDALFYGELPSDSGYARVPNGSGTFVVQNHTHNANNGLGTSVTQYSTDNIISVYPNPAHHLLHIVVPYAKHMKVYDVLGKTYYKNQEIRNGLTIDVSNWQKGVYILKIDDEFRKISIQ